MSARIVGDTQGDNAFDLYTLPCGFTEEIRCGIRSPMRSCISVGALLLGFAAPAVAQDTPDTESGSPPTPATNPATWITSEDYPAWAADYDVEGVVRFALDVDSNGRVAKCAVVSSSGVPDLDTAACATVSKRARFLPARDALGNAVAGKWTTSVRWQSSEEEEGNSLPPPGLLVVSLVVEPDGSISDCGVEELEGIPFMGEELCDDTGPVAPLLGEDGEPERRRVRITMQVEHEVLP